VRRPPSVPLTPRSGETVVGRHVLLGQLVLVVAEPVRLDDRGGLRAVAAPSSSLRDAVVPIVFTPGVVSSNVAEGAATTPSKSSSPELGLIGARMTLFCHAPTRGCSGGDVALKSDIR